MNDETTVCAIGRQLEAVGRSLRDLMRPADETERRALLSPELYPETILGIEQRTASALADWSAQYEAWLDARRSLDRERANAGPYSR